MQDQDIEQREASFAQFEGKCWCCGKKGHHSPKCPQCGSAPKADWAAGKTKEMQHAQHVIDDASSECANDDCTAATSTSATTMQASSSEHPFWATGGTNCFQIVQAMIPDHASEQVSLLQYDDLKDLLLLDSASLMHVFCNEDVVDRAWDNDQCLTLATNGGPFETCKKGHVPECDDIWMSDKSMINIFSLALLMDKFCITFDSAVENAFEVHAPCGIVEFERGPENICCSKPGAHAGSSLMTKGSHGHMQGPKQPVKGHFPQTVADNAQFYSQRQVSRAKAARDLLHATGCPSVADLKTVLKMSGIANCPITLDDVDIAEQIFGPDVASLKGKTTRQKPAPVVADQVSMPQELVAKHENVVLCMDALFVNKMPFLVAISKNIKCRTAHFLQSRTIKSHHRTLDEVCGMHNDASFQIGCIECDLEFEPAMDPIKRAMQIHVNCVSAHEHVPKIERSNHVLKEHCRAMFHHLPREALPRLMIRVLVKESAKKLNYFPPKGGMSACCSPHAVLKRRKIAHLKHCTVSFGTCVQAHEDQNPKNTQEPCTLDCICLRLTDADQVGHEVLNLATGQSLTRCQVTSVPIAAATVKAIEASADKDGMSGLHIMTKTGQILWDSAWTAGVDCDKDDDDANCDDDNVELPGVEIDEEEEEQLWEDLDENEVADSPDEAASPVQPEPQCDEEDVREQQEAASELIETRTDEEDEDEDASPQEVEAPRRSKRVRNPPSERLNISSVKGQSHSGIEVKDE